MCSTTALVVSLLWATRASIKCWSTTATGLLLPKSRIQLRLLTEGTNPKPRSKRIRVGEGDKKCIHTCHDKEGLHRELKIEIELLWCLLLLVVENENKLMEIYWKSSSIDSSAGRKIKHDFSISHIQRIWKKFIWKPYYIIDINYMTIFWYKYFLSFKT